MTARYPIHVDALEAHTLIAGTTGSGKSYLERGLVEQLRAADRRVGVVDKLGNFWGLTLAADGKRRGLDFVIFGGKRAMVPMTPDQGEQLGRLFVERNIPAIFDLSLWKRPDQERWVAAFADAVFLHNHASLHLVLDEAQSWAPQNGGGAAFDSVRRLAEQGRGQGIHLLMAVQRLSRIDKSVANMAQGVIAMRQTGTADRKAIRELMAGQVDDVAAFERDLPGLPTGTGYVWNPLELTLKRTAFPPNRTFDSSRTLRHGDTPPAPIAVSSTLVDELRKALAPKPQTDGERAASREADAICFGLDAARLKTDVDLARARIAELEDEVERLKRLGDLLYQRGVVIGIGNARDLLSKFIQVENEHPSIPPLDAETVQALEPAQKSQAKPGAETAPADSGAAERGSRAEAAPATPPASVGDAEATSDREYRALAGLVAVFPAGLTEPAWAARTGYSRKGGAWNRRRKRYRDAGLIEQRGDRWHATQAAVDQVGADIPDMPKPGPAVVAWWARRLGAPGRVLELLAAVHPRALTRDAIAAELRMSARGGAFNRHIAALKAAELVTETRKRLAIEPALLGEGHG